MADLFIRVHLVDSDELIDIEAPGTDDPGVVAEVVNESILEGVLFGQSAAGVWCSIPTASIRWTEVLELQEGTDG